LIRGSLGLTERWMRKLLGRLRAEGDRGAVHRSRGRPSNRKLPEAWRRVKEVHPWRPRRACRGELVQWDTSEHAWLEGG
jgi:hypothetical protein